MKKCFRSRQGRISGLCLGLFLGLFVLLLLLSDLSAQKKQQDSSNLVLLIEEGRLQRIKLYLRRNPESLKQEDKYGKRPLHYAAEWGHTEILEYFLSRGTNSRATDLLGNTPLHYAALWGRNATAVLLLDHSEELLEAKNTEGRTPLIAAAIKGERELVELFLARGANPKSRDIYAWDAADLAFKNAHVELGQLLRDVMFKGQEQPIEENMIISEFAFELKTERPQLREPRQMKSYWPNLNAEDPQEEFQKIPAEAKSDWTFYLLAVALDRVDLLQEYSSEEARNALHVAARSGALQSIQFLAKNSPLNEQQAEKSALHLAIQADQPRAVELLLDLGASVELPDTSGFEPVHYAALYSPESLAIILTRYPYLSRRVGLFGQNPLYLAAWKSRISSLRLLLASGAEPRDNLLDAWGPMSASIQGNYAQVLEAVEVLLPSTDLKTSSAFCGEGPLHLAARMGNVHVLNRLLRDLDVDFPSQECKQTALHLAVKNDELPAGQLLLARGANIEARDVEGNTPLLMAPSLSMTRFLLENGADAEAQNDTGETLADFLDLDELEGILE